MKKTELFRVNNVSVHRSQIKYPHCGNAMPDIAEIIKESEGHVLLFKDIEDIYRNATPVSQQYSESTLRHAMADLRRVGLRSFTTKTDDLRFQYNA